MLFREWRKRHQGAVETTLANVLHTGAVNLALEFQNRRLYQEVKEHLVDERIDFEDVLIQHRLWPVPNVRIECCGPRNQDITGSDNVSGLHITVKIVPLVSRTSQVLYSYDQASLVLPVGRLESSAINEIRELAERCPYPSWG